MRTLKGWIDFSFEVRRSLARVNYCSTFSRYIGMEPKSHGES
jgi:environmental stress-induced protein Ves